jgi:hypothetical protein
MLVFSGLWFGIYRRLPPGKYKIVSWKKKKFKDLKDLLVSFRLYFIIVEISSCIYHILFVTINIYDIDCQKKNSNQPQNLIRWRRAWPGICACMSRYRKDHLAGNAERTRTAPVVHLNATWPGAICNRSRWLITASWWGLARSTNTCTLSSFLSPGHLDRRIHPQQATKVYYTTYMPISVFQTACLDLRIGRPIDTCTHSLSWCL